MALILNSANVFLFMFFSYKNSNTTKMEKIVVLIRIHILEHFCDKLSHPQTFVLSLQHTYSHLSPFILQRTSLISSLTFGGLGAGEQQFRYYTNIIKKVSVLRSRWRKRVGRYSVWCNGKSLNSSPSL